MNDLTFWFLARITGLTVFAVLSLSVLSGEALRTSVLDFLASNRALRRLHDFTTPLWLIGLGTIAFDIVMVVTVTSWLKGRMNNTLWTWIHHTSYVAFVAIIGVTRIVWGRLPA